MKRICVLVMMVITSLGFVGCVTGNNPNAIGTPLVKGPSFLNVGIGIPHTLVTVVNNNNEPVILKLDNQYMNFKDGRPESLEQSDTTSFKLVAVGGRPMEWAVMLQGQSGTYVHNIRASPNQMRSITLLLKGNRLQVRQ